MGMVIRVYRYARQHVDLAEKQLEELVDIRKKLNIRFEKAENAYTEALANGDPYVPVSFMRSDNEFNRFKMKMEKKQVLLILTLVLQKLLHTFV